MKVRLTVKDDDDVDADQLGNNSESGHVGVQSGEVAGASND